MRFTVTNDTIEVVLSRRNLLAGLHKLEMEGSARELQTRDGSPDGTLLRLLFEDDDEHYDRLPGPMHPDTESFISER